MSRKDTIKTYAEDITHIYYNRLLNLALSRFKYENLPEGLTTRIIERQLIEHGLVMFIQDTDGVYKCLKAFGTENFNIYNEPTTYNIYGFNYRKIVKADFGVLIRNNPNNASEDNMLMYYAKRLNEIEQTKDVNLNAQKTPYVIVTDDKQRLTFKNILHQVNKFKYAIFGDKESLNMDNIKVLETRADFLLDKLQDDKNATMDEVLTYLGINNANTDKKERLIVDEVNANNEFIDINIDLMFEEREKAIKEINEKFGLEIKVIKKVGGNDELLYNDDKRTDESED